MVHSDSVPVPTVEGILRGITHPFKLEEKQVKRFAGMKYADSNERILSTKNPDMVREVVGQAMITCSTREDLDEYIDKLGTLRSDQIIFDTDVFSEESYSYHTDIEKSRKAVSITEGADKCSKCGSTKTFSAVIQTRSADEAMTYIVKCFSCGKQTRS